VATQNPIASQQVTLSIRSVGPGGPSYTLPQLATVDFDPTVQPGIEGTGTVHPSALTTDQMAMISNQEVILLLQPTSPSTDAFKATKFAVLGTGTKPAEVMPDQPLAPISIEAVLALEARLAQQ
jgi:hypothetical protein